MTSQTLDAELPDSPRIGLVKPVITINQISTGGVGERMEDWCEEGCANVTAALKERFGEKMVVIDPETFDDDFREELKDIQGLYDTITVNMGLTWQGAMPFPAKYRRFDYTVGDVRDVLDRLQVDILLFVCGLDQIRTGGRKAFETFAFLAGGMMYMKNAFLEVGLVGPSGRLLWYRIDKKGEADFREPEGARTYVDALLADFPVK